jgi:hypothetical protein
MTSSLKAGWVGGFFGEGLSAFAIRAEDIPKQSEAQVLDGLETEETPKERLSFD